MYMWNSFMKIWIPTITSYIPQTLIFMKWQSHQECAVMQDKFLFVPFVTPKSST